MLYITYVLKGLQFFNFEFLVNLAKSRQNNVKKLQEGYHLTIKFLNDNNYLTNLNLRTCY